ncbi:hypothetical protein RZ024_01780 [Citrobacter freundii]|uniref:Uncharacterized protein n=1 Tax=Citrobacter freundii TaxID=546 RepID=A0AAP5XVV4_CITFR|nr:hypothetical protein [Citrobacter freundii]MCW0941527.1 hypothetical protein [Citrobacter freundii]MDV2190284.1 hypothetical protein [Citrobacter freundii]MDW2759601.1 hypothetical protein [Citrobacter freundii]MEB0532563.1 hypothetical protein [Citrobacter freundii]WHW88710.1 hypothetical protein PXV98_08990 [Citrobacter freundii]
MSWAKLRKIQISPVQALRLAQGGEVTVLDTMYRANKITGELVSTGVDMCWRKTIAIYQAEVLINRWKNIVKIK